MSADTTAKARAEAERIRTDRMSRPHHEFGVDFWHYLTREIERIQREAKQEVIQEVIRRGELSRSFGLDSSWELHVSDILAEVRAEKEAE